MRKKIQLLATNYQPPTESGFSLIELLVVISIIGILTTLTIVNFVGVRERSRDAQRKSNMNEIKTALEFYKIDNNEYPASLPACNQPFTHPTDPNIKYIQKMPCDPLGSAFTYNRPTVTTFNLSTCLENENDTDPNIDTLMSCSGGVGYKLYNP